MAIVSNPLFFLLLVPFLFIDDHLSKETQSPSKTSAFLDTVNQGMKKHSLIHVRLLLSKPAFSHWVLCCARTMPTAWGTELSLSSGVEEHNRECSTPVSCTQTSVLLISVQGA